MVKRILLTTLVSILFVGLSGGYFYHVGKEVRYLRSHTPCSSVDVIVKDSVSNTLVSAAEVYERIIPHIPMACVDSIDLSSLETTVADMGEVAGAQAFRTGDRVIVELTQRTPVIRFIDAAGSRYADAEGYMFPVRSFTDVPVFTGIFPFNQEIDFKGYLEGSEKKWLQDAVDFACAISANEYWNKHIEQVNVASNGDFILYTNAGNQTVIFGDASAAGFKLKKLSAFYSSILPTEKGPEYKTINLKYGNQIICK